MGVYPLLRDNTCWFLAIDFDEESRKKDVAAVRDACQGLGLPAYVERSRSGKGAHLWLFFDGPILARQARALGSYVITQAMNARPELSFRSYDRLFPSQDSMPEGGFGNLIALPLQAAARANGNSVFLDHDLEPFSNEEQWHVLGSVSRVSPESVSNILQTASQDRTGFGVEYSETLDDGEVSTPWSRLPSDRLPVGHISATLPGVIHLTLAQQVFIAREGIPGALLNQVKRLAAFHNPEYYRKRSARRSTWNTPRIICCAQNSAEHLSLPRGCLAAVQEMLQGRGVKLHICDKREDGDILGVGFHGILNATQQSAFDRLMADDVGVLVAPPGSGKTVVAAALIAARKRSTLVLVHRFPILEQWRNQLSAFFKIDPGEVGRIGAGKREPNGRLDVALFQSLIHSHSVDEIVAQYGHVVVDECHHAAAVGFENVLSEVRARYVTGLTATPKRRDGHHPIVAMQLGPVRFELKVKDQAAQHPFAHNLVIRDTEYDLPLDKTTDLGISKLRRLLAHDPRRNELILGDIIASINEGRSPLVLSERLDHVAQLAERLERHTRNLFVLSGQMNEQYRRELKERLSILRPDQPRVVVATGGFVGEGFDDNCLDTLFLTLPISWKGLLVQYVGRLHRLHSGKREVRVFDYVDGQVPVLQRMFERRLRGYRSMGYSQTQLPLEFELCADPDYVPEDDWDIPADEEDAAEAEGVSPG